MRNRKAAVDLTQDMWKRNFYRAPNRRLGLWGTLIASNLVWLGAMVVVGGLLVSTTKFGTFMTERYLAEQARWQEWKRSKENAIAEREMEIARMVAFQTSSPGDVLDLARKISRVLESGYGRQRAFLEQAVPEAIRIQVQYGIPASAVVSMAIYESHYGQSALAKDHHNYFGMKAFNTWSGPRAVNMPTRDLGVMTRADFRSYSCMETGFQGFVDFLKSSRRYESAFGESKGISFVQRVLAGGYCPDSDYLANIRIIMNRHRLHELDDLLKADPESPFKVALRHGEQARRSGAKDPS
jgi:flagellum-specific peptidoglycan hydrolase FlgJ